MPNVERIRELLNYDPETGVFTWRQKPARRILVGSVAGNISGKRGYRQIEVEGVRFYAHRLAWFYVHGKMPDGDIDHIDGRVDNNAISNLRDVTKTVNMQNMKKPSRHNKTGFLGVYQPTGCTVFKSTIRINGKPKFLGSFKTAEEAHRAYISAKREHHEGNTL